MLHFIKYRDDSSAINTNLIEKDGKFVDENGVAYYLTNNDQVAELFNVNATKLAVFSGKLFRHILGWT